MALAIPQTKEYANDLLAFVNITTSTSLEELVAHLNEGTYKFDFILLTDKETKEKEWKLVIKKS